MEQNLCFPVCHEGMILNEAQAQFQTYFSLPVYLYQIIIQ